MERRQDVVPVNATTTYQIFGVRNHGRGAFDAGARRGSETTYKNFYRASAGDVVFLKLGAWEGAFGVIPQALDGYCSSSEFVLYQPDTSAVAPKFLKHLVVWGPLMDLIGKKSIGTNVRRRRLNPSDFENTKIPVPDLAEQLHIATRLDALARVADRRTDALRVEPLRQSVWNSISSAPMVRIGNAIERNQTFTDLDDTADYPYVGVRSFGKGLITYPSTPRAELSKMRYATLTPNALVVSNIKAWEGAVALSGQPAPDTVVSNRFLVYSNYDSVDMQYVHYFLTSEPGVSLLSAASPGSADRNRTLSTRSFEDVRIPLPDLVEQRRVVNQLAAIDRVQDAMSRRDELAAALLPAAREEEFSRLVALAG